jgi:tRNA threonylcarbamoyladenosine biosynthesis protein TsaB
MLGGATPRTEDSMNEPIILAIDTSTTNIVLGLSRGAQILCDETLETDQHQSKHVLSFIDQCLKKNGLTPSSIDAFATTTGPGSFTGVRIYLGTMKVLAFSMNKPLIGIPTLQAMVYPYATYKTVAPILDARRDFVYVGTYHHDGKSWTEQMAPKMIPTADLAKEISNEITLIGHGNAASSLNLGNSKSGRIYGRTLCEISLAKWNKKDFEDVNSAEPLYIQKTAAEGYV